MKTVRLGVTDLQVPAVAIGCMRLNGLSDEEAEKFILTCADQGATFFDHADIYGKGECERIFGRVLKRNPGLREKLFLQSKCGIISGRMYDLSKQHILESVDGILERLGTDHIEALLLHRPDALVEPEEVAEAFDELQSSGKVQYFGVSNMNPGQMQLLMKTVRQPLIADQLQLSIPVSNMIASGIEVNMDTPGSFDHDGSVLDFCRLNGITIQTWSPFQKANWQGTFMDDPEYEKLNDVLKEIAAKYSTAPTTIAAAWILRHPAGMQVISGSMSLSHTRQILDAMDIELTREEWYQLYLAAGHMLP